MNYTLFAIGCYIVMRSLPVLLEECAQRKWFRLLMKIVSLATLYSALASLVVWYQKIFLLGFDPTK